MPRLAALQRGPSAGPTRRVLAQGAPGQPDGPRQVRPHCWAVDGPAGPQPASRSRALGCAPRHWGTRLPFEGRVKYVDANLPSIFAIAEAPLQVRWARTAPCQRAAAARVHAGGSEWGRVGGTEHPVDNVRRLLAGAGDVHGGDGGPEVAGPAGVCVALAGASGACVVGGRDAGEMRRGKTGT